MWIYKAQQIHKSAQGAVQNKLTLQYIQHNLQKCKQVDNNNLKNIFKRSKFSKEKNLLLEFWKLGTVYFCTIKTFFHFSKLGVGGGGQPNNFFFSLWL